MIANSTAICILGMHRSGTSAVTRAVNLLGAHLGEPGKLMPATSDNPEGYWEHTEIVSLQEKILHAFLHAWHSHFPLPPAWWKHPEINPRREELAQLVRREFADYPLWAWKDPRTSLLLPLWKDVLDSLKIETRYVIVLRNPLDVAASLARRNGFDQEKSLSLWLQYTLPALFWSKNCKRIVIHYDHFLADWQSCLKDIAKTLAIPWPQNEAELSKAMSSFLKPGLRHNRSTLEKLTADSTVPEQVVTAYRLCSQAVDSASFVDTIAFTRQIDLLFAQVCDLSHYKSITRSKMRKKQSFIRTGKQNKQWQVKKKRPLVSIVTPSYNQGDLIEETIRSVLSQEEQEIEYIVIDGGSTDQTLEVLKKYAPKLKWVYKKYRGQADAVNEGFSVARGEVLGWLNPGDTYLPGGIKKAVNFLTAHPQMLMVYGNAYRTGRGGNIRSPYPTEPFDAQRMPKLCFICQPTVLIRKAAVDSVGLLDVSLKYAADYDYWIRLASKYPNCIGHMHHYSANKRIDPEEQTVSWLKKAYGESMAVVKEHYGEIPEAWIYAYSNAIVQNYDSKNPGRRSVIRALSCLYHVMRRPNGVSRFRYLNTFKNAMLNKYAKLQ